MDDHHEMMRAMGITPIEPDPDVSRIFELYASAYAVCGDVETARARAFERVLESPELTRAAIRYGVTAITSE